MIEIKLTPPKGLRKLDTLPEEISNELYKGMLKAREMIMTTSKTKYLSGPYPSVLSPDTGLLRDKNPVISEPVKVGPGELWEMQVGPPETGTWYGKVHEQHGFPGDVFPIFAKSPKGMTFFWKKRGVWVHGAQRVLIPSRPWMYPAIVDNIAKIRNLLNTCIRKGYKASLGKG